MDQNRHLRKDLIDAWERYVNKSDTCDDLALILDSTMNDEHIQEFNEVANRKWDKVMNEMPPTPEYREEIYREEFAQFFAEYQNKQKKKPIQIPWRNNIVRFRKIWYAAAAVILLGLLVPAVYLYVKPETEQIAVQYIEKTTQRGEIITVVLSDQTEVTLNAGSRIIYPSIFTGDERSVELYGEAIFDVTSDPARPFTVKTENMNIRVLGTVFDVKEYADDLSASVSVVSGKVEVGITGEKIILDKNRQVKMDKSTGNIETMTIDADNYLSWTSGTLFFNQTPIREVVNILNRHYTQVDIELAEGEYAKLISGKYKNVFTAEEILKSIAYITGLKCIKTGNKYTLYSEEAIK